MAYATESLATPLYVVGQSAVVKSAIAQFQNLSVDDKLAALWCVDAELERSAPPQTTQTARFQLAAGWLATLETMSPATRLQAIRAVVANENTPLSRGYGLLSLNTKLIAWEVLFAWMNEGSRWQIPSGAGRSKAAQTLSNTIVSKLNGGDKVAFFRQAIADMGIDPLA
ncbi:MAG: orange carotenoid protein N-terminal domain-containing protein [Cyanobacteriota bacterium]|nr:orange carotenoid protein N-terminal domain-containing protein [Cyanobacteriota bacterium]